MNGHCGDGVRPCKDVNRPLRIEVCLKKKCKVKREEIKIKLQSMLLGREISPCGYTDFVDFEDVSMQQNVSEVVVVNFRDDLLFIDETEAARAEMCLFKLSCEDAFSEDLDEDAVVAEVTELPNQRLHGLWNSLTYEGTVKEDLLEYASTAMLFSDKNVDTNIINCNRLLLLHGPPGTGKTSLCRALAHKLSIIMSNRYRQSQLFEVNSHSLFSKWFSESGKLVMRMFQRVKEIVIDPGVLICVLIDEVESLSGSRDNMASNEPSDSIRAVNALLTQLDSLKKHNNVLVIATSNLSKNIDPAFIDRVDIMQYIGNPGRMAIYQIFYSCIAELVKSTIIATPSEEEELSLSGSAHPCSLLDLNSLQLHLKLVNKHHHLSPSTQHLLSISQKSEGLSGRTLRKLPFVAHAMFIQTPSTTLSAFLSALEKAVVRQQGATQPTRPS